MGAMTPQTRKLGDLAGVGPATLEDFRQLGVTSVAQLARCEDTELYQRLCAIKGQRIDPCCLDVFSAAIAQARNPDLEPEKRKWWYWSGVRKARAKLAR
jgi:nucleotidyltransferase/DNA polymerase involved in DNA repair